MEILFHINLRSLREEAKLSQDKAAAKLGVPRPRYAAWEEGRSTPDLKTILMIMELYNISFLQLIGVEPADNKMDFYKKYNTADEHIKGAIDLLLK